MRERKLPPPTYEEQSPEESFAWTNFDRAMTEAVYRQQAPFVAGFLARLGVARRNIDDEVMRVFGEVQRHAACVSSAASWKAWVASLALRGAVRRHPLGKSALPVAAASGTAYDPSIDEFLRALEPELRAIFILFELEAEPSESIAAAFSLTVETVHERLHAGQREFRRAYGLLEAVASPTPSVADDDHGLGAFVDPVSIS
jgi:RNA polymerase sigma-70 factor (ECF subfamily)